MRTRLRLPVVAALTLGGLLSVGHCRQGVRLAVDGGAGGPPVGLAALQAILFFAAAGVAWRALAPRPGESIPTVGEALRGNVRQAVSSFPPVVLATAKGVYALVFGWGLFIIIDVAFVMAAASERTKAQAHEAAPDGAAILANFFLVASLLPLALILRGTWGVVRDRHAKNPIPRFAVLAFLQTALLAVVVVPLALFILVFASGHGVSD